MKILEVNNIDLLGSRFNGYDLMEYINKNSSNSCNMAVIHKLSDNDNVFPIAFSREINMIERLYNLEQSILSVHSILSISSSLLMKSEVYKEADIVHFHMFHNSHFSLFDLKKIAQEKKVIISLHDPWFVTGHCVHPFECEKWKFGCKNCPHLDYMFPMKRGQAGALWNLKKSVFNSIDCDLIVSSPYMKYLVKNSPILKRKRLHYLPLGIDTNKFVSVDSSELRKKYGIKSNDLVFF